MYEPKELTDAGIIQAVRSGTHVLVPRGGNWSVGDFSLDSWEEFEGERGLMVSLSKDQCKEVAGAFFSAAEMAEATK